MTHLEKLIYEYYDWQGYLVKSNVKVGKLAKGGWEMELDIIAYNPATNHLIHIEPSLDAHSWEKRESRFIKKFEAGKKYIFKEIFKWLDDSLTIEQIAILITHPKHINFLAGGKVKSIDEFTNEVFNHISNCGIMAKNAIPEQYPLLRTIQLISKGYYKSQIKTH